MVGDFIKRLFNVLVLVMAALAFFLLPLGKKTAAQHLVAIFNTPQAREAGAALASAARRVAAQVQAELEARAPRQE